MFFMKKHFKNDPPFNDPCAARGTTIAASSGPSPISWPGGSVFVGRFGWGTGLVAYAKIFTA